MVDKYKWKNFLEIQKKTVWEDEFSKWNVYLYLVLWGVAVGLSTTANVNKENILLIYIWEKDNLECHRIYMNRDMMSRQMALSIPLMIHVVVE